MCVWGGPDVADGGLGWSAGDCPGVRGWLGLPAAHPTIQLSSRPTNQPASQPTPSSPPPNPRARAAQGLAGCQPQHAGPPTNLLCAGNGHQQGRHAGTRCARRCCKIARHRSCACSMSGTCCCQCRSTALANCGGRALPLVSSGWLLPRLRPSLSPPPKASGLPPLAASPTPLRPARRSLLCLCWPTASAPWP